MKHSGRYQRNNSVGIIMVGRGLDDISYAPISSIILLTFDGLQFEINIVEFMIAMR